MWLEKSSVLHWARRQLWIKAEQVKWSSDGEQVKWSISSKVKKSQ